MLTVTLLRLFLDYKCSHIISLQSTRNNPYLTVLMQEVFLHLISNYFGKNTVNCIHFELIPV